MRSTRIERAIVNFLLVAMVLSGGCAKNGKSFVKKSEKTGLAFVVETIALTFAVTACGSGNKPAAEVTGNTALGTLVGATITLSLLKSDGTAGATIGLATSAADGTYSVGVASLPTDSVLVTASGGSYVDEATGVTVVNTQTVRSVIPSTSFSAGGTTTAAVNSLTDIATARAVARLAAGDSNSMTLDQVVTNALYAVGQGYGIPDPLGTLPASLSGTIAATSSGQVSLILAGIAKQAAAAGVDALALTRAIGDSFARNGNFATTTAVSVVGADGSTKSVAPCTMTALASSVTAIQNGSASMAGMTGVTFPDTTKMAPPSFVAMPTTIAPNGWNPGTTSSGSNSASPSTVPSASCAKTSRGSCTVTSTAAGTMCNDLIGSNMSYAMFSTMCTAGTASTLTCAEVNPSRTLVGGICMMCDDPGNTMVTSFYDSATVPSGTAVSPRCTNGTHP